jgi:hypothetical protein
VTSDEVWSHLRSASRDQLRDALISLLDQCAREDSNSHGSLKYLYTAEIYRLLLQGSSV